MLKGLSMIIAPLLLGASTFFWHKGEYGITGGTVIVLSMIFWIPAFGALFQLLKNELPYYASFGYLVAIFGCISGANFGIAGVFSEAFGISHQIYLTKAAFHALAFNILLFWSGPLFPLSLLVLGILLAVKKVLPIWVGILICLGAIVFPLSRIPRIEIIAHIADILLAIPLIFTGVGYLSGVLIHASSRAAIK